MKKFFALLAGMLLTVSVFAAEPPAGTFQWNIAVPFSVDYQQSVTLGLTSSTVSNFNVTFQLMDASMSQYVQINGNVLTVLKHYPGTVTEGASGCVSDEGHIRIKAVVTGMAEYDDTELETYMTTNKISPNLQWNCTIGDMTLGSTQTLSAIHQNTDNPNLMVYYDAIDDESWPSSKVSIDNSTGVMTAVGRGSNIYVVAIIDSTDNFKPDTLYYLDSENIVKFNVTKGYRSISWDNTDLSNLDNMMPDVDIVLSYPMNTDAFEVTSSDESIATITADGKLHILKAGVVTLSAKVYATDDYFEATSDTTISISAVATTIAWEQNVVNGIESSGFITATLKDYSLNNFCSSNYKDGVRYIFSSSDPSVADISQDSLLTCYKMGTFELTAYAVSDGGQSRTISTNLTVNRGKMRFISNGKWNDSICWLRPDLVPNLIDFTVDILADCELPKGVAAECHDMTIYANGSLKLRPGAELWVMDSLQNLSEEQYFQLMADSVEQSHVYFRTGEPRARVQRYMRVSLGDGMDTVWSYNGVPVKEMTLRNRRDMHVKSWDETMNQEDCWVDETAQMIVPVEGWKGYMMTDREDTVYNFEGNIMTGNHEYYLTYTRGNHESVGKNFITNSYAAPIHVSALDFKETESQVFFNRGGQWVVSPKYTAYAVGNPTVIETSESVFLRAERFGATVNVDYAKAVWGEDLVEEDFNVLKIAVKGVKYTDTLSLVISDKCSADYDDGYDGTKWFGSEKMPQLFVVNEWGRASVNADSQLAGQKIGFKAGNEGEAYTLTFDTEGLSGYDKLYLYDMKNQNFVDIMAGESYQFVGSEISDMNRFTLMCEKGDEGADKDGKNILVVGDQVLLIGFEDVNTPVRVLTPSGQLVCEFQSADGPWFELPGLVPGIYLINAGKCTRKFVR